MATDEAIEQRLGEDPEDEAVKERLEREHGELLEELRALIPGAEVLFGFLLANYLRHTSQVYGVFAIVLGLLFWLYLGARLTLYAAEVNVVAARRLWPRSLLQPPLAADQPTQDASPAAPLPIAGHQQDRAAPLPPTPGHHRDLAGDDAPPGR